MLTVIIIVSRVIKSETNSVINPTDTVTNFNITEHPPPTPEPNPPTIPITVHNQITEEWGKTEVTTSTTEALPENSLDSN